MPLFTESPGDRSFERMMTSIPGFRAKRHGTVEYPVAGMARSRYPPNRVSEATPMDYRNEKHRFAFTEAAAKRNQRDWLLMSALYLLTAEPALWTTARNHVNKNTIDFEKIRLKNSSEDAYVLFCCAKDLYLGTKHITVKDLADRDLIKTQIFTLICNAIVIHRFGLYAILFK